MVSDDGPPKSFKSSCLKPSSTRRSRISLASAGRWSVLVLMFPFPRRFYVLWTYTCTSTSLPESVPDSGTVPGSLLNPAFCGRFNHPIEIVLTHTEQNHNGCKSNPDFLLSSQISGCGLCSCLQHSNSLPRTT